MYDVIIEPKAQKQCDRLPEKDKERTLAALRSLRDDPWQGKKLGGRLAGYRALRVWPYRIVYRVEKKRITVTVVSIDHRKDVYRRLS